LAAELRGAGSESGCNNAVHLHRSRYSLGWRRLEGMKKVYDYDLIGSLLNEAGRCGDDNSDSDAGDFFDRKDN
jgi:hypothetical protein